MTDRTTTGEVREALDDLHLTAHYAGPTDDASAGHRRGADLWDATRAPGSGDTVRPWADLDAVVQAHTAAVITRALADVLEVEQVMYRALVAVLDLAVRLDAEAEALHDFSGGMSDESEWLEATATRVRTIITTALGGGTNA